MTKTYEVTKTDEEEFVVETATIEDKKTYQKDWIEEEISRLQAILAHFKK